MAPHVFPDTRPTINSSFVSTLKRFFKAPKSTDDRSCVLADVTSRTGGAPDLDASSVGSQVLQNGDDCPSSPFGSRRTWDRQFHANSTGAIVTPALRPVHASHAALYHSISDPCDTAQVQATLCRTNGKDAACVNSSPKPVSVSRLCRNPPKTSASFRSNLRPDAALPSLYEPSARSCSLDLQTCSTTSGSGRVPSLPSVDGCSSNRSLPVPCGSITAQGGPDPDFQGPEPTSTSPKATLLAMCPATPPAMRRRDWILQDYDVTRKIYRGSTSAVYKGTCRRSGLPVALKVYFLSRVPSNVIHMIVREIKIHTELVHKNIVMLYAAFQDEKRLVLVQEYAARGDLYGIHRAMNRRMTEAQLTSLVLAPFMDALSYLHSRGICHRDIKPENILFAQEWRLVIADFGVSIDLNQERAVTRAGTLEYMAPEVERCPLKMLPEENKDKDSLAYTTAVDIWAVGVLAYELLVGFPPFVAENPAANGGAGTAFLAAHATRKTLSFPASTSAQGRDFISLALAETPEERPTALQLCRHPWLTAAAASLAAAQQPPVRRSTGQLASFSATPLTPSRLASSSLAFGPATSGQVSVQAV